MPQGSTASLLSTAPFDGYGLDTGFASTLQNLLDGCRTQGLDFRISQGLRTPQKQAEYYCQWSKRTPQQVDVAAAKMQKQGAPWLAGLLTAYRDIARTPNWLTDAVPGAGWHQWGLAADCYCFRNGTMVGNGDDPVYTSYANLAQQLGLTAGLYFTHKDAGHVQARPEAWATSIYTWPFIDQTMRARFGDKEAVALASLKRAAPA